MCMKNVNLTAMTADILVNESNGDISLANIDHPVLVTIKNNKRTLSSFTFAVFMQAIEGKNKSDFTVGENINQDQFNILASEKLIFSERYAIKIRLTESKSGKVMDLDEFELCPNDSVFRQCICCDTFKYTRLCAYNDIVLPDKVKDDEFFVVKILIKHLPTVETENSAKDWTVQAVYPIVLQENDN